MSDKAPNSDIFTQINDKLGIAGDTLDKLKEFLDKTKDVIKKIGEVAEAIKVTVGIIEALDLLGEQKSEMDVLFEKIQALFTALMNKIDAESKHVTQLAVADKKGDADEVVTIVRNYLASKKTDLDKALLVQANSKSIGAVTDLMQLPFWQRTFGENALTALEWGDAHYKPPVDAEGLVWDYRLTLPSLLNAISARIFYLTALDADFRSKAVHGELSGYAEYLKNVVYQTIYKGIVRTPAPLPKLMSVHSNPLGGGGMASIIPHVVDFSDSWETFKSKACGAVDTYAGSALIQNLPFQQPTDYTVEAAALTPSATKEKDRVYRQKFYFLFAIRVERALQHVYDKIGLAYLWNFIGHIKNQIGDPFPALPPEQGYSLRMVINSPIRKIIQIRSVTEPFSQAEEPLNLDIAETSGVYSLKHMGKLLGSDLSATTPIAGIVDPFPISLRVMLAGR